jgi:hypothetical protein
MDEGFNGSYSQSARRPCPSGAVPRALPAPARRCPSGAARPCPSGAARRCPALPGAARRCPALPGAARRCPSGAARRGPARPGAVPRALPGAVPRALPGAVRRFLKKVHLALALLQVRPHITGVGGASPVPPVLKGLIMSHSGFIGAVRNSTIIGQVQGAPVQAHSLPNSVSKTSPALWVTKGHFVCEKTLAEFLTANGGPGRVIFVPFKNKQDPTMLAGLIAKPGTTRQNCLVVIKNGVTLLAAGLLAKHGPPKPGAPVQKGRPNIKSAYVAWLQGSYNPVKHGGSPLGMLVALPE